MHSHPSRGKCHSRGTKAPPLCLSADAEVVQADCTGLCPVRQRWSLAQHQETHCRAFHRHEEWMARTQFGPPPQPLVDRRHAAASEVFVVFVQFDACHRSNLIDMEQFENDLHAPAPTGLFRCRGCSVISGSRRILFSPHQSAGVLKTVEEACGLQRVCADLDEKRNDPAVRMIKDLTKAGTRPAKPFQSCRPEVLTHDAQLAYS